MKRKFYPLLLAAAMSLTACTEVLEPNIDYGGNTYINDYTALVKAVNDLQKSLEERFDALNTLLKNGMADIKLSIDQNTGAINVLTSTTQNGLDKINTSLFDGFKAISEHLDSNGNSIIEALNNNNELLRITIDSNGKLIDAAIKGQTAAIVAAINDQTKALNERIDKLNQLIEAGLKDIKLEINANTGAITLLDQNTNSSLGKIDTDLLAGFANLNTNLVTIDQTLTGLSGNVAKVETAINTKGDLIVSKLDKNNTILETKVVGSLNDIKTTLESQTTTMSEKIQTLNDLVASGLIKMDTANDKLGTIGTNLGTLNTEVGNVNGNLNAINGSIGNVKSELSNMNTQLTNIANNISNGFTTISKKMGPDNTTIVEAINANGEKLTTIFGENGQKLTAISTALSTLNSSLTDANNGLPAIISAQKELNDAISGPYGLTEQEKQNAQNIINMLEKMMVAEGIYTYNGDIYMDLAAWTQVSQLGTSSATYQEIMNVLTRTVPGLNWEKAGNVVASHKTDGEVTQTYGPDCLVTYDYGQKSNLGTTKSVYKIIKTPSTITYKIDASDCSYKDFYRWVAIDAGGTHSAYVSWSQGKGSLTLNTPLCQSGKWCSTVQLTFYCR